MTDMSTAYDYRISVGTIFILLGLVAVITAVESVQSLYMRRNLVALWLRRGRPTPT